LWYRGLALKDENDVAELAHIEALFARHNINRVVIGHSTTPGAVLPRFGGRILQIDVGLGPYYGDNEAFLVIENGVPIAMHRGQMVPVPITPNQSLYEYLITLAALDPQPSRLNNMLIALEPNPDRLVD
jgi:hypothetical protein